MLRRDCGDDSLLITQVAHARLSGQMAAHIGNTVFAPPSPFEIVVKAIAIHDEGWPLHDDLPTIDPQGLPTHTFEMPLETALRIWAASTEKAVAFDPYAGLLVSLHGLGLSLFAQAHEHTPREMFDLNKFQHKQIEIQESLRQKLHLRIDLPLHYGLAEPGRSAEEDLLLCNFRLLQLLDRISLNLCFDIDRITAVENIFPRPGVQPLTLHIARLRPGIFSVDPWPFDRPSLSLSIPARRIKAKAYRDNEELRRALVTAAEETIDLTLQPAA